jgi:hypothetical protein
MERDEWRKVLAQKELGKSAEVAEKRSPKAHPFDFAQGRQK